MEEDDDHKIEIEFNPRSSSIVSAMTLDRSFLPNAEGQGSSEGFDAPQGTHKRHYEVQAATPPTKPSFNIAARPVLDKKPQPVFRQASTGDSQAMALPTYEELQPAQLQETIVEEEEESQVSSPPRQMQRDNYRFSVDSQQLEIQARSVARDQSKKSLNRCFAESTTPSKKQSSRREFAVEPLETLTREPVSRRFTEFTVEPPSVEESAATPRSCDDCKTGCDAPRTPPRNTQGQSQREFTFAPLEEMPVAPNLDDDEQPPLNDYYNTSLPSPRNAHRSTHRDSSETASSRRSSAAPRSPHRGTSKTASRHSSGYTAPQSPHRVETPPPQRRRQRPTGWANDIVFDPQDFESVSSFDAGLRASITEPGSEIRQLPREIELDSD